MRRELVFLLALTGCKYLEGPKKVAELEKRLDEVSAAVSDLTGEPVGQRPGKAAADDEDAGGKGPKGAKDKKAKAGKDTRSAKDSRDAKDAKDSRDAKDPKDTKVARSKRHAADDEGDSSDDRNAADRNADDRNSDDRNPDDHTAAAAEPAATSEPPPNVAWSYAGADGPSNWSKLAPAFATCSRGQEQSPIDILPRRSQAPEVIFVYHPTAATVVDDGHDLEVDLTPGSFIVVDGTRYDLIQFHFHTPGEHTIAGDGFPMELHLVHRSKAGALAVVAILFTEGAGSTALAPVWKSLPKARGALALKKPFDPTALLPVDQTAYRYDGSLTTPPCTEHVIWEVLRRQSTEDVARMEALHRRFGDTARPVQDLGEREVH